MNPHNISHQEFNTIHGGRPVESESRLFWPDGWSSDMDRKWVYPAPTDPIDLLKAKKKYIEVKLAQEIQNFSRFKNKCNELSVWHMKNNSLAPPPPDAADKLRKGKKRIASLRVTLSHMNDRLAKSETSKVKRKHEQIENDINQRHQKEMIEINSISID